MDDEGIASEQSVETEVAPAAIGPYAEEISQRLRCVLSELG